MQIVRDNCGLQITDMIKPSHRCNRSTRNDIYILRYNLSWIVGDFIVILTRLMSRTCKPGPHPFPHARAPHLMVWRSSQA